MLEVSFLLRLPSVKFLAICGIMATLLNLVESRADIIIVTTATDEAINHSTAGERITFDPTLFYVLKGRLMGATIAANEASLHDAKL